MFYVNCKAPWDAIIIIIIIIIIINSVLTLCQRNVAAGRVDEQLQ